MQNIVKRTELIEKFSSAFEMRLCAEEWINIICGSIVEDIDILYMIVKDESDLEDIKNKESYHEHTYRLILTRSDKAPYPEEYLMLISLCDIITAFINKEPVETCAANSVLFARAMIALYYNLKPDWIRKYCKREETSENRKYISRFDNCEEINECAKKWANIIGGKIVNLSFESTVKSAKNGTRVPRVTTEVIKDNCYITLYIDTSLPKSEINTVAPEELYLVAALLGLLPREYFTTTMDLIVNSPIDNEILLNIAKIFMSYEYELPNNWTENLETKPPVFMQNIEYLLFNPSDLKFVPDFTPKENMSVIEKTNTYYHYKIKIGDGKTPYKKLPYSNNIITDDQIKSLYTYDNVRVYYTELVFHPKGDNFFLYKRMR